MEIKTDEKKEKENLNKNKITQKHLNNLDEFIQKCLDNFKFVDPKQELYDATGEDKNIIISHKSTIPDLVIWNKSFNKNNCFVEASSNNKETKFPRFLFYIKIKKNNKKAKKNNMDNKININNSNSDNLSSTFSDNKSDKSDANYNMFNNINNMNYNYNYNNIKNNKFNNKPEEKNKFLFNPNNNISNNINNINLTLNLVTYLIQLYLYKDGWIILTNDNFSGPGTSINLYQFLQEKLKDNCNLDNFVIIDINKQVKFTGYNFYNLLSNVLNKILQKKQMELIKFEEIMSKNFKNYSGNNDINEIQDKMNNMDINNRGQNKNGNNNNSSFHGQNNININLYNNQIFPGINYIENINNNISNANFIQNNITNYNIQQHSNNKNQNKK